MIQQHCSRFLSNYFASASAAFVAAYPEIAVVSFVATSKPQFYRGSFTAFAFHRRYNQCNWRLAENRIINRLQTTSTVIAHHHNFVSHRFLSTTSSLHLGG